MLHRRLLTVASASSLLLCVATAALWALSYDEPKALIAPNGRVMLETTQGQFFLVRANKDISWIVDEPSTYRHDAATRHDWICLQWMRIPPSWVGDPNGDRLVLQVPCWFACSIFLSLPAAVAIAWLGHNRRRVQRIRQHRCAACGYDLTGNVSGICPECGASIPQMSEGAA